MLAACSYTTSWDTSGSASLTVYAPGANGNQAPLFTVTGSSTALNGPVGLAL